MSSAPAVLERFFVYNPRFGPKEDNEEQKILYHYPRTASLDEQMSHVGLSEAMTRFTETFTSDYPCESLHTKHSRYTYLQPEEGYWMVMMMRNPRVSSTSGDGKLVVVSREDELSDPVLRGVIEELYGAFRLFNGDMERIVQTSSVETLRRRLDLFYSNMLRLYEARSFSLVDTFAGVRFFPVDRTTYLSIQSFCNLLLETFPWISNLTFMYETAVIYSALDQKTLRTLFQFLRRASNPKGSLCAVTSPILVDHGDDSQDTNALSPFASLHLQSEGSFFAYGPAAGSESTTLPSIHIEDKVYDLVIYEQDGVRVAFTVDPRHWDGESHADLQRVAAFAEPEVKALQRLLVHLRPKADSGAKDSGFKFFYFNQCNLALKDTLSDKGVPRSVMRDVESLYERIHSMKEDVRELTVHTASDPWVVARKANGRELYVVLDRKYGSALEVDDEINRLTRELFSNVFMQ